MKACANLSFMFHEAGPLVSRYKAAALAGFKYVESDFPRNFNPQELESALKDAGVSQILINCDQGDASNGEMGFAAEPNEEQRFKKTIENTIIYAKALKCQKMHILSGRDLNCKTDQVNVMIKNLCWASARLKEENILALIEPINPESKPGYFLNNYETALQVIKEVNSPNLKLQLDLFHLQKICGNLATNLKKFLPYTGHIQVAQPPHRGEPSSMGEINYFYVFKLLKQFGYEGFIGCEYTPTIESSKSLGWLNENEIIF